MSTIELTDGDGVVRFRGTSSGGSQPFTGWTADEADPANVDSNGGNLDVFGLVSLNGVTVGEPTRPGLVGLHNGVANFAIIRCGTADPTAGAGVEAHEGSLYLRTNGQQWGKTGAADTDWTQLGGSPAGAIKVVRVPLAFDTPNLVVTGITVYTPAVGDVLLESSFLSVTTAWDGATPGISLYSNGDAQADRIIDHSAALTSENDPQGSSVRNSIIQHELQSMYLNASAGNHVIFDSTAPVKLMVDDGAGGNPGSAAGAGEFVLIIAPAA